MSDMYTKVSVIGKTKSTAKGSNPKSKKSSESAKRYFNKHVGKETKRTGTKRIHKVSKGNFDGVITFDMLPPATTKFGMQVRRAWMVDPNFTFKHKEAA